MRNGFNNGTYVEAHGRSGGLALWWIDEWDIRVITKTRYYIDIEIKEKNIWHFTSVYEAIEKKARKHIFEEIQISHVRSQHLRS